MSRRWTVPSLASGVALAAVVAACLLVAGSGLAVANEPPLAEAGLDQTVDVETAVYLDAGGSSDPDGTIANTSWTVVAPNGTVVNTSCANCTRTAFTPDRPGRYAATVTVTDDAGASTNDTLYVTARVVDRPSIDIVGPNETTTGTTSYVLDASPGDAALLEADFVINGTRNETVSFSDDGNATVSYSFSETGTVPLRAVVRDVDGYTNQTQRNVTVVSGSGWNRDYCGQISIYGAEDADPAQSCSEYFEDDLTVYLEDERVYSDLNADGSIPIRSDSPSEADGSETSYDNRYSNSESSDDEGNRDRQGYDYSNWGS